MADSYQSHHPPTLTFLEKLGAAPVVVKTVFFALLRSITSRFGDGPASGIQVQATIMRNLLGGFNWRQQVAILNKPSNHVYKNWVEAAAQKTAGYENASEYISGPGEETRIMWIGKPWSKDNEQRKVLLYFHGGGYVASLNEGHLKQNRWIKEELETRLQQDVSIGVVEYSLAPGREFPAPLHQGVLALNHLLAAGCAPSNIALAGDSAGGNLSFGILSHILHPYPGITKVLPFAGPLASIATISPWVAFFPTGNSCQLYRRMDMVTPELIHMWGELAVGGRERAQRELEAGRFHAEALFAPESWWKGLNEVVKIVGMTAGSHEILTDDIQAFYKKIEVESGVRADLLVAQNEVHDQILLEGIAGLPWGGSAQQLVQWLEEGFKQ